MASQVVAIDGSGVAACCCAQLLQASDTGILINADLRNHGPVLMLSGQTQKLLSDVFRSETLFQGAVAVRRRIVLWAKDAKVTALPHSGLVMSESDLLKKLWHIVSSQHVQAPAASPEWKIISAQRSTPSSTHNFGSRMATASTVKLKSAVPQDACWMESLNAGWLFLLPCGYGTGSLISVGEIPATLLGTSNLIAEQIDSIVTSNTSFAAYPRISSPLCAAGWIACGTAALGFDPICGEGAGNAVREAILACAVISAAIRGLDPAELLGVYASRLMSGFRRHLALCLQFYRAARQSDWWQAQIDSLEQGLAWSERQVSVAERQKYRLQGFELQTIA